MPYVKLKFPPGVFRNGTLYETMGRWYSAELVRWTEGTTGAIGGWQATLGKPALLAAAIADDGGVFTDETDDANDAGAGDVQVTPATPVVGDAFYVGFRRPFTAIEFDLDTAGADHTITWEYWDGDSWESLSNVTDGTSDFTSDGTVTFTAPTDWATTTINSQGPFYYVRARVSAVGGSETGATATTIDLIARSDIAVGEPIRGVFSWLDDAAAVRILYGTPTKLYSLSGGQETDVTPSGFTTGGADSELSAGDYDAGNYGQGPYGGGDESAATLTEANTWQFDNYGEIPIALAYSDGKLYEQSTPGVAAFAAISNAPTGCLGVVVTPERVIVALGAGGDPRYVKWSDQLDRTVWTAAATNTAGDYYLPGQGKLQCGARLPTETLILTDVDAFALRWIGGTLIYRVDTVGSECGVISRRALAVSEGRAYWMGRRGFFVYEGGFVKPIPCPVSDDIFEALMVAQRAKVSAWAVPRYHEIWFSYPTSTECDRIVCYNYMENHWSGPWTLERTSGFAATAYGYPLAADSAGHLYDHERGESYLDTDFTTTLTPSAESGPFEIGQGEQLMMVRRYIPDEDSVGDAAMTLRALLYPTQGQGGDDTEDTQTLTVSSLSDARLTGRQVRLDIEQVTAGWRFGTPRLEVVPRGRR